MIRRGKYLFACAFMGIALVGCGSSEVIEGEAGATEETVEETLKGSEYEFVAEIVTIDDKGILFTNKNNPGLGDFYIKKEYIDVIKDDKTSVYDVIFFYEGFLFEVEGTEIRREAYTEIIPCNECRAKVTLSEVYKGMSDYEEELDNNIEDIIVDENFDNAADKVIDAIYFSFSVEPELGGELSVAEGTSSISIKYKEESIVTIMMNGHEEELLFEGAEGKYYARTASRIAEMQVIGESVIEIIKENSFGY